MVKHSLNLEVKFKLEENHCKFNHPFFLLQMLDMIRPQEEGKVRLKDLKSCSLTPIFFDTFFNLDKYLEHEQKDPFASIRVSDSAFMNFLFSE